MRPAPAPTGTPNISQDHTSVVGGVRYSRADTRATPERARLAQYSPYPPSVDSTTTHATAVQNPVVAGGASVPVAAARPVNRTALTAHCTASAATTEPPGRVCRSRSVAATRESIAPKGSA